MHRIVPMLLLTLFIIDYAIDTHAPRRIRLDLHSSQVKVADSLCLGWAAILNFGVDN